MNYAFRNGKILDGTKEMKIQQGLCILVENGIITDLIPMRMQIFTIIR